MFALDLALWLALGLAQPQTPAATQAGSLLRNCTGRGSPDAVTAKALEASCIAYIGGVVDGLRLTQLELSNKETLACLPVGGGSFDQYRRVAVKFMEDNPNILHEHQGSVVIAAMINAFPCQRK
jgi:hypothetical protein